MRTAAFIYASKFLYIMHSFQASCKLCVWPGQLLKIPSNVVQPILRAENLCRINASFAGKVSISSGQLLRSQMEARRTRLPPAPCRDATRANWGGAVMSATRRKPDPAITAVEAYRAADSALDEPLEGDTDGSEPSPARSRTRGQRTATGPMPVTISRSGRCPWAAKIFPLPP
jgi:hypothetical protein